MFTLPATTLLLLLLLPLVLSWAVWLWLRAAGNRSPLHHRLALRLTILAAWVLVLSDATWQQPVGQGASGGWVAAEARPPARQESAPPVIAPHPPALVAAVGATSVAAGTLREAKRHRRGG